MQRRKTIKVNNEMIDLLVDSNAEDTKITVLKDMPHLSNVKGRGFSFKNNRISVKMKTKDYSTKKQELIYLLSGIDYKNKKINEAIKNDSTNTSDRNKSDRGRDSESSRTSKDNGAEK